MNTAAIEDTGCRSQGNESCSCLHITKAVFGARSDFGLYIGVSDDSRLIAE